MSTPTIVPSVPAAPLGVSLFGGADPLTAGFNAAAAFFAFLSTPMGQKMLGDMIVFDENLIHTIHDLFVKTQEYIAKKA